jgi:acyl-CoA synthetase (NDP forming)
VDVAFAIDPTPTFLETVDQRERRAEARSIARLLRPRSVAVIGASERSGSVGRAVLDRLLGGGFDGPIHVVNPNVDHVANLHAYDSVLDIQDDVHLAVIAVPKDGVRTVIEECAAKHVRGVVVMSTGYSEVGDDARERELVDLARGNGMRLIGPASLGLVSTPAGLVATMAPTPVRPGRVGISSQSGPLGTAMLELANRLGMGVSTFVSLGNKADVSANDFLNYWDEDPDTDVILLYTESFGNPRKFGRVARRVSRRKPIVAVKAGEPGDQVAVDALYAQAGVIRVGSVRELLHTARILECQPLPTGPRVAVVTNAASPAVLATDSLLAAGLQPAAMSADTRAELHAQLPGVAHLDGAVVDLTFRAVPADYRVAMDAVLADHGVDSVLVIHTPPLLDAIDDVAEAVNAAAQQHAKPVVAVSLGRDDGPLAGGAVPAFSFPEPACAALGRITRYAAWRARPEAEPPSAEAIDLERARAVAEKALTLRPTGTLLPLVAARELLDAAGIAFAPAVAVTSAEAARQAAEDLGYPVTLKAAGLERLARSESGGVALDLQDEGELLGAYHRMQSALGEAMAEAMVQRMVPGGVETIVQVEAHPAFGPVVSFGLGGAFADEIADRTSRSLPLTTLDVAEMLSSSRALTALLATKADLMALERLVGRVGLLVDAVPEVARLRLNPVLASASGAWAVDVRIHVAPPPVGPYDEPLRRL